MFVKLKTITLDGIEAREIEVQVHLSAGQPGLNIVGLANKAVTESKERVRSAILSLGLSLPPKRITVNLAPSNIQKDGTHYDLPIALAVLCGMNILDQNQISNMLIMGELSLDGSINYINGALPCAILAIQQNVGVICPFQNGHEVASVMETSQIIAPNSLLELINYISHGISLQPLQSQHIESSPHKTPDMSEVYGQKQAKKALEIAMAGGHNLIMIGPPGSGKSMLAQRAIGLLPKLTTAEMLEVSMIHSVSGILKDQKMTNHPPFRSPHHSASMPAIVGGGRLAKPGEVSLAHRGILFLDEFAEFPPFVLDALRQPLETGEISISRAESHITYPAKFQLIAAMNPCKCGYFGNVKRQCHQIPFCMQKYTSKISGPIMERIDIQVFIDPNNNINIDTHHKEETSQTIAQRISQARTLQYHRQNSTLNAHLGSEEIKQFCKLNEHSKSILQSAQENLSLSMREYFKIIKVARTIADLAHQQNIETEHITQALSYRTRNQ